MLDYRIFGRGRVTYDSFEIDPSIPLAEQARHLMEDLLQVEYANNVILDLGWYPDCSPDGQCWVTVVTDSDWANPRFERSSTDYRSVVWLLRTGAKVAEWLVDRDGTLPLTLHTDNNPGVQAPTWATVLEALLAMNGQENTLTCLEAHDGRSLMIGGGNDGRFLVDCLVDPKTQKNYVLTDPTLSGPAVELCCGGQAADYPAHWCVDLRLVLEATHHYCTTGGMAAQLPWEEGC